MSAPAMKSTSTHAPVEASAAHSAVKAAHARVAARGKAMNIAAVTEASERNRMSGRRV